MQTNQSTLTTKPHYGVVATVVALILAIPLVAMQVTPEVQWGPEDFIVMGALLTGAGLLLDLIIRKVKRTSSQLILGTVVLLGLLTIWAQLAVGAVSQLIDAISAL